MPRTAQHGPLLNPHFLVGLDSLDILVAVHGVDRVCVKGHPVFTSYQHTVICREGDWGRLLEALDQRVLVADLAALVACVLLGPALCQPRSSSQEIARVPYASTCSGDASSLQVTYDVS